MAWKYWLKFSSPDRHVPQGVMPPAQLLNVPSTRVPVGFSDVLSRSSPAAGPVTTNSVRWWMRRLYLAFFRFVTGRQEPGTIPRRSSTTDMPWLARLISAISWAV